MGIVFKNITRDTTDLERIIRLYHNAFPSDERAPFDMLLKRAKRRNVNFFSCRDGEKWIGFIYIVNYRDASYVFYFAVDDEVRGKGYGTAILKAAQKKYRGRKLFLAIEEVDEKYKNYEQRIKRRSFYENAGFVCTGQKLTEGKVIYDVMSVGGRVDPKTYRLIMSGFAGLYVLLYTAKMYDAKN
ncbi:MAG: GNAT family N-acetyltransferase [Ruminococcus sp.]|nr:GNAT family N-acetyltransferase [Ruminococcus sp.]